MGNYWRERTIPAAVLAALTAAVVLLTAKTGPAGHLLAQEDLAAMAPEAAEAALLGLPRQEVLRAWGEPDGSLSGLFGDIYTLEDGRWIVVYYDTRPMSQGADDGNTIPVEHVVIGRPVKD